MSLFYGLLTRTATESGVVGERKRAVEEMKEKAENDKVSLEEEKGLASRKVQTLIADIAKAEEEVAKAKETVDMLKSRMTQDPGELAQVDWNNTKEHFNGEDPPEPKERGR